jgi:hypothetical protein
MFHHTIYTMIIFTILHHIFLRLFLYSFFEKPLLFNHITTTIPLLYHDFSTIIPRLFHYFRTIPPYFHYYSSVIPWFVHRISTIVPLFLHDFTIIHDLSIFIPWFFLFPRLFHYFRVIPPFSTIVLLLYHDSSIIRLFHYFRTIPPYFHNYSMEYACHNYSIIPYFHVCSIDMTWLFHIFLQIFRCYNS